MFIILLVSRTNFEKKFTSYMTLLNDEYFMKKALDEGANKITLIAAQ